MSGAEAEEESAGIMPITGYLLYTVLFRYTKGRRNKTLLPLALNPVFSAAFLFPYPALSTMPLAGI
jgi:hypothetical protein